MPLYSKNAKKIEKEAKKIHKNWIYRIKDLLLYHPTFSISISMLFAILLGAVGSVICDSMSENLKKYCLVVILIILGLLFTLIIASCIILRQNRKKI